MIIGKLLDISVYIRENKRTEKKGIIALNIENLFDLTQSYSQIEDIIIHNLEAAEDEQAVYNMTGDFILNIMNLSGKNPEDSAVLMAALFELPKESFLEVVTFSYYIAALEFWSYVNQQEAELQDVIANVNRELARCKDVTGAFLGKVLPTEAYTRQLQIFCKNFSISDSFQDTLGAYLADKQMEIVRAILEKLAQ